MLQGSGILCTMLQRWVAKLDEYGTQATSGTLKISGPDQHHFNSYPDTRRLLTWCGSGTGFSLWCGSVSLSDFQFHADPDSDPVPRQGDANLRPLVYRPSTAPFWTTTHPLLAPRALHCSVLNLRSSWCGSGSCFPKWGGSRSATLE